MNPPAYLSEHGIAQPGGVREVQTLEPGQHDPQRDVEVACLRVQHCQLLQRCRVRRHERKQTPPALPQVLQAHHLERGEVAQGWGAHH
jgi:hypothetical protein